MTRLKLIVLTKSEAGMTLVEIMMSIMIFLVLLGGILGAAEISRKYWISNKAQIELQQDLRLAMLWLSSDLRQAGSSSIFDVFADGVAYPQITFKIPVGVSAGGTAAWTSDTIQFKLGGDAGDQLQRISGTDTKLIASNIQSLSFRRTVAMPDVLEVSLIAVKNSEHKRPITVDLDFSVFLRN